jgi:hypothetical protein
MSTCEQRVDDALLKWTEQVMFNAQSVNCFNLLVQEINAYNESAEALVDEGERITVRVWSEVCRMYFAKNGKNYIGQHLLDEMYKNRRWRRLFDSEKDAHAFVFTAALCIEQNSLSINKILGDSWRERWAATMPDWIEREDVNQTPQLRAIAAALFGEPWCVLVYDAAGEDASLARLVATTKPEFLPDRLTYGAVQHASPLPDLVC